MRRDEVEERAEYAIGNTSGWAGWQRAVVLEKLPETVLVRVLDPRPEVRGGFPVGFTEEIGYRSVRERWRVFEEDPRSDAHTAWLARNAYGIPLRIAVFVLLDLVGEEARVLVERRSYRFPATQDIVFPGGKFGPGELAHHAMAREAYEEAGVVVEGSLSLSRVEAVPYDERQVSVQPYLVTRWSGDPRAQTDRGHLLEWVSLAEALTTEARGGRAIAREVAYWAARLGGARPADLSGPPSCQAGRAPRTSGGR